MLPCSAAGMSEFLAPYREGRRLYEGIVSVLPLRVEASSMFMVAIYSGFKLPIGEGAKTI